MIGERVTHYLRLILTVCGNEVGIKIVIMRNVWREYAVASFSTLFNIGKTCADQSETLS